MARNVIVVTALAVGWLAVGAWGQASATAPQAGGATPQSPQVLTPGPAATTSNIKKKGKDAPANIRVAVVVTDAKGVPVPGAGVVLRQNLDHNGYTPKNPFQVELHTDEKGQIVVQGFEPGELSVQVIAKGFQTWGKLLPIKDADEKLHVDLALPKAQITIYH